MARNYSFSSFSAYFDKQIHKTHKITSYENNQSKIWYPKFWSLGTTLGYMGPLSLQDVILGPCRLQFLVIWDPCEASVQVALGAKAKNPNSARSRCAIGSGFWQTQTYPTLFMMRVWLCEPTTILGHELLTKAPPLSTCLPPTLVLWFQFEEW